MLLIYISVFQTFKVKPKSYNIRFEKYNFHLGILINVPCNETVKVSKLNF